MIDILNEIEALKAANRAARTNRREQLRCANLQAHHSATGLLAAINAKIAALNAVAAEMKDTNEDMKQLIQEIREL